VEGELGIVFVVIVAMERPGSASLSCWGPRAAWYKRALKVAVAKGPGGGLGEDSLGISVLG
jgi:hypothetical protein